MFPMGCFDLLALLLEDHLALLAGGLGLVVVLSTAVTAMYCNHCLRQPLHLARHRPGGGGGGAGGGAGGLLHQGEGQGGEVRVPLAGHYSYFDAL